jgi:hypothetical protein
MTTSEVTDEPEQVSEDELEDITGGAAPQSICCGSGMCSV